jgi:type III secretion protein V
VRGELCEAPDFLAQRSHANISRGSYPLGFKHLLTILGHYANGSGIGDLREIRRSRRLLRTMIPVVTPIALEVSADLIPIVAPDSKGASRFLDELLPWARGAVQTEFGFELPGIRICGNETDMPPGTALTMIDEVPEMFLTHVGCHDVLVDSTVDALAARGIPGEARDDPATGRARTRIAAADRVAAEEAGITTWDAAEYLSLVVQAAYRRNAAAFIDLDTTWRLVELLEHSAPDLVAETVPRIVSWFELTDVLARLVEEEIGIGDTESIVRALLQRRRGQGGLGNTTLMTEWARHALNQQITAKFAQGRNWLQVFDLDAEIESLLSSAIQYTSSGMYMALEPDVAQEVVAAISATVAASGPVAADAPILVRVMEIRRFVRNLVSLIFPSLHVVSLEDLDPALQLRTVARIRLGRFRRDVTATQHEES